jgi:hypothetical protein
MDDYHFRLDEFPKHSFIIRKLPDGKEEEARDRVRKWIKDCEMMGKKLEGRTHSFNFDDYLPV